MSDSTEQQADVLSGERLSFKRWKQALDNGRLLGQQCENCSHGTAAPKAACAICGSRTLRTIELPDTGTVYSMTTVHVPPEGFEGPYTVGLVAVGNARVTARLDADTAISDTVVFDDAIETTMGPAPVFVPIED